MQQGVVELAGESCTKTVRSMYTVRLRQSVPALLATCVMIHMTSGCSQGVVFISLHHLLDSTIHQTFQAQDRQQNILP